MVGRPVQALSVRKWPEPRLDFFKPRHDVVLRTHRSPGLRHRRGQPANTFRDPSAEHSEMHPTLSRLAESVSKAPLNLTEASAMLYPPIPLYRRLLRAHRNLPREMRSLGDDYVKSEFRRHKEVTNPVYIMGFLSQWKTYLDQMPRDPNTPFTGKRLDPTVFEKMSDEQLGQLYELMHAAKDVWKPVRPGDGEEQKS